MLQRKAKVFVKNFLISSVAVSTILGTMGPFLFFPKIALAAPATINHWSVWQADGAAGSGTTTLWAHVLVGDDTASAGGSPDLIVSTVYKNPDWTGWASTTCFAEYTNSFTFRCSLPTANSNTDARTFKYYIDAYDGSSHSFMSWATDTDNRANARNYPMQTTVYNTPTWSNGVSAQVLDGRQYYFSSGIPSATSTIYISSTTASTANLAVNDWIVLKSTTGASEPKMQISSILGYGDAGTRYQLQVSGYTLHDYTTSDYIQEYLDGALVWVEGTTIYGTTTDAQATTTFGGISLYHVPDGSFDVVAFKEGYGQRRITNNYLYNTATSTLNFNLSFGGFEGGGNIEGASIIWTAPSDGMMGAPADISVTNNTPIMIALSGNASSSTITKDNIKLQTASMDGTYADFSSYYAVDYEPANSGVTIGGINYEFGPDAKILVHSSSTLATSTGYIVKFNSSVKDANNNPIQGNNPAGGYTLFFSTSGGYFSSGGITIGNFGTGGSFMPPFAMNIMPNFGSMNVARNTKIVVQFDQAMASSSITGNIQVNTLSSSFTEGAAVDFRAAFSDTDKSLLIITPTSNLAASTRYRVKLLGGLQSSSGVSMAPPGSASARMMEFEFETSASADTSSPTILATGLDRYLSGTSYTAVPSSSIIKTSFSEPIDPTTINSTNLYLRSKGSTSNISATVKYDIMEGKAILAPSTALTATTTYILTLTGYIKDLTSAQNGLATTTYEFTTGGVDETGPKLNYFNADDYSLSLTFDEPMSAAKVTDTSTWPSGSTKWQTSVLNPANYLVYVDNNNGAPGAGSAAMYYSSYSLASSTVPLTTLTYDALNRTVKITGLTLLSSLASSGSFTPTGVRVWVKNAADISGNVIQTNAGPDAEADNYGLNAMGVPVKSSATTFGQMGPGGGMFAPPSSVTSFTVSDFGGKNPAMMGMMPVGIWPMNMMAGATSTYSIDIPVSSSKAIPASGKIIIGPFPDEAVVSLVRDADPNKTFAHKDINGPNIGTVQIASVTASGQTVTVTLGSVATQAPDFIHLELDNIKNPTTPSQGGYKISIQTQKSDGTALESFTSMPFFIMPKGKYTLVGHVTTTDVGLNGVSVFGGGMATGQLFTASLNNAFGSSTDGEFKIEGLNSGDVTLMTEQVVTVGSDEYIAPMPASIFIDDNTSANNSGAAFAGVTGCTSATACYVYKEINLTRVAAGTTPGLVVYIYGDFATSTGTGYVKMDIFAGGSGGFRVKEVSLNGDYSSTPFSAVLNLPSTGDYSVGIGPAMPKGMGKSAPSMPTGWMPPKPAYVSVSGSGGNWTWTESDSSSVATSTSDGLVQFTIQVANKTISGHVYDNSGTAVANAEVFAYSPTEFFGTGTHVLQDGSFTLNVKQGFYKVGAFLPGAPPSGEIGVEVRSDAVWAEGVATTDVILRLSKDIQSGYTISGTVYSDTSSQYPGTDASVYAYRTDGPGHAETMTDSKGTYTLYVGSGTWKVGAYLPTHGKVTEKTIAVPPSKSGLNFTPDTTISYVTVRERIWQDANDSGSYDSGEGLARASVSLISTSTEYYNSAVTDENGLYEIKVPASTTYDLEAWSPDVGSLPAEKNLHVTTTDIIYTSFSGFADLRIEQATTVEFGFYDVNSVATTVDKAIIQLDRSNAIGAGNGVYKEGVASTTLQVATSTSYIIDIELQGIPKHLLTISPFSGTSVATTTVSGKTFATTTVDGYERIMVILPAVSFVSGQVKDGDGNAVGNAVLHIEQPGTDVEFDIEANASGIYAFVVASSSSPYLIQADKSGYIDSAVSVTAATSTTNFNPTLTRANRTVSGTVTIGNAAPGGTDIYVWAEKLGGGYGSTAKGNPSTGAYTISLTDGSWILAASAEGYSYEARSTVVDISGSNISNINLRVSDSRTLEKQETLGMAGNVGGALKNKESGFQMNVPRGTISASDSSSYNVKEKEISNIPGYTPTGNLVGNRAEEVSAYKMSGSGGNVSTVSGLNGSAFIDKTYTKAELAAESIDTVAEVEEVKMGSYDSSSQNWKMLPTAITYIDSSSQPVIPTANLSNVASVNFKGATKHFSTFGVINSSFDGLAPAAPVGTSVTNLGNSQLSISWNAVTANSDGTTASDLLRYAIYRSDSVSGPWTTIATVATTTLTYTDNPPSGSVYYYRVTADTGLQSGFSASAGASASSGNPGSGGSSGSSGSSSSGGAIALAPTVPTVPTPTTTTTAPTIPAAPAAEPAAAAKKEVTLEGIVIPKLEKAVAQMTKTELTTKIAEFLAVISQLQALVAQLAAQETPAAISGVPSDFQFSAALKSGQSSDDIKYLQIVLNSDPDTRIAASGLGSAGKETKFFGALTRAAVIKFQEKYASEILASYGLTKGTGLVGPSTRAKLNKFLGK